MIKLLILIAAFQIGCSSAPTVVPVPVPVPPPAAVAKTPRPGHYIATLGPVADITKGNPSVLSYATQPGVKGLILRYTWKELEPTLGNYNLTHVASDLEKVRAVNRRVVVLVLDKSFNPTSPLPDYMSAYAVPMFIQKSNSYGVIAKRWDPYVVGRLNALLQKLASSFDSNSALEGLAIQESAVGNFDVKVYNYDSQAYGTALANVVTASQTALKHSKLFWYQNYIQHSGNDPLSGIARLEKTIDSAILVHPAIGGPDVLPDQQNAINTLTPVYKYMVTKYPAESRFCSMQNDSFSSLHVGGPEDGLFWTMQELFDYSRTVYGCNYMFWNIKTGSSSTDKSGHGEYTVVDALKVVAAHPTWTR